MFLGQALDAPGSLGRLAYPPRTAVQAMRNQTLIRIAHLGEPPGRAPPFERESDAEPLPEMFHVIPSGFRMSNVTTSPRSSAARTFPSTLSTAARLSMSESTARRLPRAMQPRSS